MKRFITFFTLSLLTSLGLKAQLLPINQPEQNACDALVLCGNSFTSPYAYQGRGSIYDLNNTPCSGGEDNVMWIRLNINTAGTIVFDLTPIIPTDDYDFAVVNITGKSCSNFTSADVIRCNFNNNNPGSNVNGTIGLATTGTQNFIAGGTTGNSYAAAINALPGDVYLIMINNFGYYTGIGGPTSGFTIDFTGSTATFNQPDAPLFTGIVPACDHSQSVVIQLDQVITCASIAADGSDFRINNGGTILSAEGINCTGTVGYTNEVLVTFANPLSNGNYRITANVGTDNNTLLNLCGVGVPTSQYVDFMVGIDPIEITNLKDPACQYLQLTFNTPFSCNTVAPNGSDFEIIGPSTVNIASATPINCTNNTFTNQVLITLTSPIYTDGVYNIRVKNGNDGNTLQDECGRRVPEGRMKAFTINSFNGKLKALPDGYACYFNEEINLTAQNSAVPPSTGFDYRWTSIHPIANPNVANTVGIAEHVINTFHLSTVDENGCVLRDSATITVKLFDAVVSPDKAKMCEDDPIQLTVNGGQKHEWTEPTTALNSLADKNNYQTFANPPIGTHTYYVKTTNERGCIDTDSVLITVVAKPTIVAYPHDTTIKIGKPLTLRAEGGVDYSWTPLGRIYNDQTSSPTVTPIQPTTYVVMGTNADGCWNYDSVKVNIDYTGNIFIPNAFTPNNDGLNDVFSIINLQFEKLLNFQIFDRYGKEVFQTQDPQKGWDGTYPNGDKAPTGVYYYYIKLGFYDSTVDELKGDITLIR